MSELQRSEATETDSASEIRYESIPSYLSSSYLTEFSSNAVKSAVHTSVNGKYQTKDFDIAASELAQKKKLLAYCIR